MMITEELIRTLVEQHTAGTDIVLVDVKVLPTDRIRVYIDAEQGVTVKDCISVSRYIEQRLDREENDFDLEVSSPGLTEPFRHPVQFRKNVGRDVSILTHDGKSRKGKLLSFSEERVGFMPQKGKKKEEAQVVELRLDEIKEIKTVISFK